MKLTRALGLLALTTTLAFAQQSGQDATGHGQSPAPTTTTNRQDTKVDLAPAGTSVKNQYKSKGKTQQKTTAKKPTKK
jgi:hypothetical protein